MPQNSIEKQLQKICAENDEYKELYSTWNLNKEAISQILNNVVKDYPHYSLHDTTHSKNVLSNIEKVLGDEGIESLSPTDMWLILHVAYFHDSGMVIENENIHELWTRDDFKYFLNECADDSDIAIKRAAEILLHSNFDKNSSYAWALDVKSAVILINSKYYRSSHGEISEKYINHADIWGIDLGHNKLIQNRLVNLVGVISALHTHEFNDIMNLHKESNGFKNDYMHPRFVACLLRLGDVLDLDNGRFNPFVDKIYGKLPNTSLIHRDKHESTTHILITPTEIEVEANCNSDETYREITAWFDSLKSEVEQLQLNWNDIAPDEIERAPRLAKPQVLRDGKIDKWGLSSLKMEMSQSKTLELIQGASFYKDKFICLREIIQNAEDASKIQLWRDIISGRYYSKDIIDEEKVKSNTLMPYDIPQWIYDIYAIKVVVENSENEVIVKVSDRGIGITTEKLKRMCNIGLSYNGSIQEKQEIKSMPKWLQPTGSFGIGLQSCFLLTDNVVMNTKAESDNGISIKLMPPTKNSYPIVDNKDGLKRGTTVELHISNDIDFSFSMFGYTHKQLTNIDPFKSKDVVIYKTIETILSECNSSLFKIKLQSKTLDLDTIIGDVDNELSTYCTISEDKYWSFSADYRQLICWYNSNFYKIALCDSMNSFRPKILFKGKKVDKTNSIRRILGLEVIIDIYGRKTEETLTLNRDELKKSAIDDINKDLNEVLKFYFQKTNDNVNNLGDSYPFCNYVLSSAVYNNKINIEKFKRKAKENKTDAIIICDVLQKTVDGTFEKGKMSFLEMIDQYPNLSYIDEEIFDNPNNMSHPSAIKTENLCQCLNTKDIDDKYIVIDIRLIDFLRPLNRTLQYVGEIESRDVYIYKVITLNNNILVEDTYTKEKIIKSLIYTNNLHVKSNIYTARMCVPAIKDYEAISVKQPEMFLCCLEYSSCYIISPLTINDAKKCKTMDEQTFIENIIETTEFKNLVEYVKTNSIAQSDETEIIDGYKSLLGEYYSLINNIS